MAIVRKSALIRAISLLALALVIGMLAQSPPQVSASSSQRITTVGGKPVAFSGVVPAGMKVSPADVFVVAMADRGNEKVARAGLFSETIPEARVRVADGRFHVGLDLRDVAASFRTSGDIVEFTVYVQDQKAARHKWGSVAARSLAAKDGFTQWVDPLEISDPTTVSAARRAAARPPIVRLDIEEARLVCADAVTCASVNRRLGATEAASAIDLRRSGRISDSQVGVSAQRAQVMAAPKPPKDCEKRRFTYFHVGARTIRPATIGTAYPLKGDKGWMDYEAGTSHEFVATFGGAAAKGNWGVEFESVSGKTFEGGWGFEWDPKGHARSFRTMIQYERRDRFFECMYDKMSWWSPERLAGTTGENSLVGSTRPKFKQCSPQNSLGTWRRYRSDGKSYSFSAGVKFKDMIGLDLSTARSYNKRSMLMYKITKRRFLCGNNALPSKAGKVGEYNRRQ